MAKGRRKSKGTPSAETLRALEARKRAETVAGLGGDIIKVAFGFFMSRCDEHPGVAHDVEDPENGPLQGDMPTVGPVTGLRTITGTLPVDPDDPDEVAGMAELEAMIEANGGELTFGPGEFSIGPDGFTIGPVDGSDDGPDDPGIDGRVPERVLDHPLADEALSGAMPYLVQRMGPLLQPFLGSLLSQASQILECVHRGRIVGLDEALPVGARECECELFAIPYAGPADAVSKALASALTTGLIGDGVLGTGFVAPGSRLAILPGLVPLDALCRLDVHAVRSAVRGPTHRWMEVWRAPEPDWEALAAGLGGVPASTLAGADGYVAGALFGVRMLPAGKDGDWLSAHDVAEGERDPDEAWQEWVRHAFGPTGVALGWPGNVGSCVSEAASLLVETVVEAENVRLDLEPDAFPDRTVVLEEEEALTLLLLHDRRRRVVGPITVPRLAVDRDPEAIVNVVANVGGGEDVELDDRAEFDRILAEAVAARGAPREGAATPSRTPMSIAVGDRDSRPRTAGVIPFRPKATN